MSLIKNIKAYPTKKLTNKRILLMCGFGGSIWQTRLLINVLNNTGYNVTAIDFSKTVLSDGNPQLLPDLVQEVMIFAEKEARRSSDQMLLVGISLGSLLSLNLLRRSKYFTKGVMITGGDIVKVAHNYYGKKVWPQSYDELSKLWENINIYSDPKKLFSKRLLFVLPSKDKLIDPKDVRREVKIQVDANNKLILIERHLLGHIGTIIEETILFPKRIIGYIRQVEDGVTA